MKLKLVVLCKSDIHKTCLLLVFTHCRDLRMCVSIYQQIFYKRRLTSVCICFFPFIFLLVMVACKGTAFLIYTSLEKGKKKREKMTCEKMLLFRTATRCSSEILVLTSLFHCLIYVCDLLCIYLLELQMLFFCIGVRFV